MEVKASNKYYEAPKAYKFKEEKENKKYREEKNIKGEEVTVTANKRTLAGFGSTQRYFKKYDFTLNL